MGNLQIRAHIDKADRYLLFKTQASLIGRADPDGERGCGFIIKSRTFSKLDLITNQYKASSGIVEQMVLMTPPPFVIGAVECANHRSRQAVLGNPCIVKINIACWPVDRHILAAKHKGAILVGGVDRDGTSCFCMVAGVIGMHEGTRSRNPFVRREGVRCTITPIDAVPCTRIRARVNNRPDMQCIT